MIRVPEGSRLIIMPGTIANFTKDHPNVSIQLELLNFDAGPQKFEVALRAGNPPDAIVMHPGPMNRGVEIDSPVADGPHSVILPQVTFGIAVRMAVMSIVAGN